MKKTIEILTHFNCESCGKWWAIGDAPADKKEWYCPWCGASENEQTTHPTPMASEGKDK